MSLIKSIRAQLGMSATATQNFTLDAGAADGTMKLARGNAGATTQDIFSVDAAGLVTLSQGRQLTLAVAQAMNGLSEKEFVIPSWAKKITVMGKDLSLTGSNTIDVQGSDGTYATTGYAGGGFRITGGATPDATTASNGFVELPLSGAADTSRFFATICQFSGNEWVSSFQAKRGNSAEHRFGVHAYDFASALQAIRIRASAGTFDAGTVNILYEG
jgi:hypothetical protein